MSCTLRIAADTAKLGQPEINLGLIPGYGGTQRLARLIGAGPALELLLTGRPITAQEAHRLGLVNRVVPAAELNDRGRARWPASSPPSRRLRCATSSTPFTRACRCRLPKACGSRRRSSGSSRAPTTCARARGRFSRSARPSSRGDRSAQRQPRHVAAAVGGFRLSVRDCGLQIQRRDHHRAARRRATGATRGRRAEDDVEVVSVPGAFELPQAARSLAEAGGSMRSSASAA